ncbi:hypothetical protein [Eggerthella sinensis]|uniref:hypothetical protein n=1 Tax=Eggerthella sinensis TaxID=242230 RepID=UPI001D07C974|nr:hypothetical protein [Eggerthella sinensis]MCB7039067.1 hypothetical protein [Eggerthella sinensis]
MIAVELRRAFANKLFAAALAIGLALALAQLVTVVVPYGLGSEWAFWRAGSKGYYPNSIFNSWMGATSYSIWSVLYFFVLPLVACLPYADTLYSDVRSGYAANVVVRGGASRYFSAKALAVFLTAGTVGVAPQLLNLLGTALLVPALQPEPTAGTFFVSSGAMLADLFYSSPWLYTAFFMALCFAVCGLVACSCLVFSYLVANRFMVLVAPFLVCAIAFFALGGLAGYSPINLLNPAQVYSVQLPIALAILGAVALLEAVFLAWRCRNFEAL